MSHRIEHLDMTVVTNKKMKQLQKVYIIGEGSISNKGTDTNKRLKETISLPYLVG